MALTQTQLMSDLSERHQANAEIEALLDEQNKLASTLIGLKNELLIARDRVDTAYQRLEQGVGSEMGVKDAQAEAERLRKEIARKEDRQNAIDERLQRLHAGVQALDSKGASMKSALAHERQLAAVSEKVSRLRALIAEHEQRLDVPTEEDGKLEALQLEREELLATIATGEGDPAHLEELDTQINALLADKEGVQAREAEKFRDARQTVAGLQKKLAAAEAELMELKDAAPFVLKQYLASELSKAAEAYNRSAEELATLFLHVQVIYELASRVPGPPNIPNLELSAWRDAVIPVANLPGLVDLPQCHDADRRILFSAEKAWNRGEMREGNRSEKRRLQKAGLNRLVDQAGL